MENLKRVKKGDLVLFESVLCCVIEAYAFKIELIATEDGRSIKKGDNIETTNDNLEIFKRI